jgi:very-short-patch-repair endonuclease
LTSRAASGPSARGGGKPRKQSEPGRELGPSDFARLAHFYLACVEEEDLRSLTLRLAQHHRSFASPWEQYEPLLSREAPEVTFDVHYEGDRKLLLRGEAQAGEVERFFYGYPCFLDEEDFLTPLFVMEVGVGVNHDGTFTMRPVDPNAIQVNHHLFRRQHAQVEELRAIQDELEGPFGSFGARLRAAFGYLGSEPPDMDPEDLDPFPGKHAARNQWINRPILFRSERSAFTFHLRRELDALVRYERLLEDVMDTSLGFLLDPNRLPRSSSRHIQRLLEVLPLDEQKEGAARKALAEPFTVVTGPPGTGKSQLVVDLLASSAAAGQAVLFASKNNKAVDVVRERLRAILGEECDWTLRLGSGDNMDRCREELVPRLASITVGRRKPDVTTLEDRLDELQRQISVLRGQIEEVAKAIALLETAQTELRVAEALLPEAWVAVMLAQADSIQIDDRAAERGRDEALALSGKAPLGFWLWLRRLFRGQRLREGLLETLGSVSASLPTEIRQDVLSGVGRDTGYVRILEGFERVLDIIDWLDALEEVEAAASGLQRLAESATLALEVDSLKKLKAELAAEILRQRWTERVADASSSVLHLLRRYFDLADKIRKTRGAREWVQVLDDFTETIRALGASLPVWIVTNLAARRSLPLQPNLFDLVIIDEASQCDVASALPLLFRARRAVVIGDPRQLRHISTLRLDQEHHIAQEASADDLLPEWSYASRSLYDVAEYAVLASGTSPAFLAEHYRSHPDIIEFSNRVFYRGRLVLRTDVPALARRLEGEPLGVFWHDTPGTVPETSRSATNEAEMSAVLETVERFQRNGLLSREDVSLGIVTPFRLQMERIEEALRARPWWGTVGERVTVGTAHRFQGDECDIVLFSPVVASGMRDRTARWVAETDQLLNVAITRARGALHIFGDLEACRRAGGYLAQLANHLSGGQVGGGVVRGLDSEAEERMARILQELGLWCHPHYPEQRYELDFLVVSPFGNRYDVEVDGLMHWTPEQLREDEVRDRAVESAGYRVIRVAARDVWEREELVRLRLSRII